MMMNQTELSYRKTAIEGASPIGLVIALYDTLAGDLRRAANAIREYDIEKRSRELNHAAMVLGQLEAWIDLENGGELAKNLSTLYSYLRAKMIEAAVTKSAPLLEAQMELIVQVRSAWQQRDVAVPQPSELESEISLKNSTATSMPSAERIAFTISA